MRLFAAAFFLCGLVLTASVTEAQPPGQPQGKKDKGGKDGGPGGGPGGKGGKAMSTDDLVATLMAFDANKDGKLTKDEITDARLTRLFDRADANKDGTVTKEELADLFTKEASGGPGFGGGGPGGKGGPGGPGGFGGPPQPGVLFPPFLQDQLGLTESQKKQIAAVQKDVDAKLEKLLTDEQKKTLKELRDRGPGGPPPKM